MKYIVTRRYRGKTMRAEEVNIPALTEADERDGVIRVNGKPVCFHTSNVAHRHFARNDDGQGMKRGELTCAIAYADRKRTNADGTRTQRFTDGEIETLETRWGKFLKPGMTILFNHEFFNADIGELEEMANDIQIKR